MTKIISIDTERNENRTIVRARGNGRMPEYLVGTLDLPARIVIDLFCKPRPFKPMTKSLTGPALKSIRVGYHPKKVRLVLDINGSRIPAFSTRSEKEKLIILVEATRPEDIKKMIPYPVNRKGIKSESPHERSVEKSSEINGSDALGASCKEEASSKKALTGNLVIQSGKGMVSNKERNLFSIEKGHPGKAEENKTDPESKLTKTTKNDGRADTVLLLKGLSSYRDHDWSKAIKGFNQLLKLYPDGRYAERTYFLLAGCYSHLYPSDSTHLTEIIRHYETAINRFPSSQYVPDALVAIGNQHYGAKNYHEAIGYYNLVINKNKDSIEALRASVQKAKTLHIRKKYKEALSILRELAGKYPNSAENIKARIETSKILYEMSNFRKSLNILSELSASNREYMYLYPDVPLYLGYNYYQLGNNLKARENLLRFYNCSPKEKINHLVLTQIGDTYRNEGLVDKAAKFYQLVLEIYSGTEGAVISKIRLAAQQEKGELKIEKGVVPPVKVVSKGVAPPKESYEEIRNNFADKDKKDPLAQLAMLKLALLHQKEGNYEQSLKTLNDLFQTNPEPSLKKEAKQVLSKTFESALEQEVTAKRYTEAASLYENNKKLFSMIDSPGPLLSVGKAFMHLNLESSATRVFKRADSLMTPEEKPPDLLYLLAKDHLKAGEPESALTILDSLLSRYPSDEYAPYAYQLKGEVLLKQQRPLQAEKMFSAALSYSITGCKRTSVLIDKARTLMEQSLAERALAAVREAGSVMEDCENGDPLINKEVGDLFLKLGRPKEALSVFKQALKAKGGAEDSTLLNFKIAQCYRLLDKGKDSLALYDQIAGLKDPFWSHLAEEKIEEIRFERQIKGKGK